MVAIQHCLLDHPQVMGVNVKDLTEIVRLLAEDQGGFWFKELMLQSLIRDCRSVSFTH